VLRVKGPAKNTPGTIRQPLCGTLTLTGQYVALAFNGPTPAALTLTGHVPTRVVSGGGGVTRNPSQGALTLVGLAPARLVGVTISIPTGHINRQSVVIAIPVGYL